MQAYVHLNIFTLKRKNERVSKRGQAHALGNGELQKKGGELPLAYWLTLIAVMDEITETAWGLCDGAIKSANDQRCFHVGIKPESFEAVSR